MIENENIKQLIDSKEWAQAKKLFLLYLERESNGRPSEYSKSIDTLLNHLSKENALEEFADEHYDF